eukprot:CAMPEP_0114244158 /NCGR_PEP_ID=MMETSP0058-20121206/11186_1 /TAXON_ID=36894 /ORGANISM="Pyramimonas parkeae, CCMP726" /LENGTH=400 /DNA_ID=CAMNT_0001357071 /DNA_START=29 /DNA_END=1232 /DNA_ORIENTATION=+
MAHGLSKLGVAASTLATRKCARLSGRGVVRIEGRDSLSFLQGLVTNDTSQLGPASTPLYAAFLTPHGRVLFDVFLHSFFTSGDGDRHTVLGDVDKEYLPELLAHIKKYKLRANVDIADVSDEFSVWANFGCHADQYSEPNPEIRGWFQDPRVKELGLRGIFSNNVIPAQGGSSEAEHEYYLWRTGAGVAEGPVEIPIGKALPLEYNLEGLSAISFYKGCYLGQELTARSYFRGVVRKRVMPIRLGVHGTSALMDSMDVVPGNNIYSEQGKKLGRVCTVSTDFRQGLALLRLKQALNPQETLRINNSALVVQQGVLFGGPANGLGMMRVSEEARNRFLEVSDTQTRLPGVEQKCVWQELGIARASSGEQQASQPHKCTSMCTINVGTVIVNCRVAVAIRCV